jgi:hypothetical protein
VDEEEEDVGAAVLFEQKTGVRLVIRTHIGCHLLYFLLLSLILMRHFLETITSEHPADGAFLREMEWGLIADRGSLSWIRGGLRVCGDTRST